MSADVDELANPREFRQTGTTWRTMLVMKNRTTNPKSRLTPPRPASSDADDLPVTVSRAPLHDRLLPLQSVMEFAGLGKTMIYRMMREGNFPAAYKPGGHASRWSERELIDWQAAMAAKRYQPQPPRRP
ncbi:AlpA family phage regulatory protein [Sphingomonas sp. PB2P19]|uniref:helix-turn-helix transcriptional regulator n=1 Tax=Sphingomonas rhamnosi TaxID=3096156 RepID=UPI002FCC6198